MKFTTAWAKVAAQNVTLKVATVTLSAVAVVELLTLTQLALRDPLVIERACYSRAISAKPAHATDEEIKAFLSEALPMRFDSNGFVKDGFLAIEETTLRDKEQAAFKNRQMNQKILISDVKVGEKFIAVLADRLISFGQVKSVLPLELQITLQQTNRSESNPYGLILQSATQIEKDEKK